MATIWLILAFSVLIVILLLKFRRNQKVFNIRGVAYDETLSSYSVYTDFFNGNLTASEVIENQCNDFKREKLVNETMLIYLS